MPKLIEIGPVVTEKNFKTYYSKCVFAISLLSLPGKGCKLNPLPFIQGCFVPSLVEIGPVVLE